MPTPGTPDPLSRGGVKASIEDALTPLRKHVETIDARIAELDTEKAELVDLRRMAQRVLAAANSGKPGPKPKTVGSVAERQALKVERLDALRDWIDTHAADHPEGITVNHVFKSKVLGLSKGATQTYMHDLADMGFIRLDHVGGIRGGEKFYKRTSERRD